ncbi:hypothetical protein [Stackebrandtia nassauensis]|uniref:Uncharacterized protein n=1 Tax=Stackebrandtia nassauensis (strain DSM 44728 / CIP 108903 / NRRL B-16338 / NBRC 102104 / LLR-40K-21) TaxID=446470 RepID=D3PZ24_STANL|nr:hypothetical protein [Stackebrandtia nassauensis]ADD45453.1 hypothetical protein Snas_5823 [Stackebrandtia nassauensis DSM 44728]
MPSVRDRLTNLNIVIQSPDRSVRANVTQQRGITVDLDDHVADFHDDATLAEQVESALTGAAQGFAKAAVMIRREAHGGDANPDSPAERKRRELERRMEEVEVSIESPLGHVAIGWLGADAIAVTIKPGSLRKLRVGQLRAEINAAVMGVSVLRQRQGMDIYTSIYGFDRFGKRKDQGR